eukprot:4065133-Pleurochrysis_carterae.AAC.1
MARASCFAARRAAAGSLGGARRLLELDEAVHDALLDYLFAERTTNLWGVSPDRARSTRPCSVDATE